MGIARESIRAVGKIALQQYDVNAIVDRLLQFLEMEKDYVTAETLVSIVIVPINLCSYEVVVVLLTLHILSRCPLRLMLGTNIFERNLSHFIIAAYSGGNIRIEAYVELC